MSIRLPNSCFVHIPRTGGLWFGKVVETLGIKHQLLKGDIDGHFTYCQLPDNWKELHSFSFIRHPFAWVKSRWSHAQEIHAWDDYRHYGIHRKFDECLEPTLEGTIEHIIHKELGLVSRTYKAMLTGVDTVIQTERLWIDLPVFLSQVEGINAWKVIKETERFNGTSDLSKYGGSISHVSDKIMKMFLGSESKAIKMWENAANG